MAPNKNKKHFDNIYDVSILAAQINNYIFTLCVPIKKKQVESLRNSFTIMQSIIVGLQLPAILFTF